MIRIKRETGVALLVAGTFFMENLDGTVITTALPAMASAFQVDSVALGIGVSAYMLALGFFIPVSGWLAERFGGRRIFSLAILLFTIASLLCGRAENLWEFAALRVLQGLAGAMMVPVGRLVVLRQTPKERLITTIATLTWPALVAPVIGPVIGGVITTHWSWRWIFFLNIPLGLTAFVLSLYLLPKDIPQRETRFDWRGFLLIGLALAGILGGVEGLGQGHGAPLIPMLAGLFGTCFLWAGINHLRSSPNPLVSLDALRHKAFRVTVLGGSLFRIAVGAVPLLLPLMFQVGFGMSAVESGLLLMAVFLGNLIIKPATTPILRKFGFRKVLVGNGLVNCAGLLWCACFTAETPHWVMAIALFMGGMTRSMQFTAYNTLAFAEIPAEKMTGANTLFSTVLQLFMGMGAAFGAISARGVSGLLDATGVARSNGDNVRGAFIILAVVSLLALIDAWRLSPRAAENITQGAEA